jgi:hypothetical protein
LKSSEAVPKITGKIPRIIALLSRRVELAGKISVISALVRWSEYDARINWRISIKNDSKAVILGFNRSNSCYFHRAGLYYTFSQLL